MARDRSELQSIFKAMVEHVYFQPPSTIRMQYPCILYKRDYASVTFADNIKYLGKKRYLVTVIDDDPDSVLPAMVDSLPYSSFDRFYTGDDLNHDVYNVFF